MSSEAAVRSVLRRCILAATKGQRQEVIEEFWVPPSQERVDVAVIGTVMRAFEIKTVRDNLKRLPRQVEAYGRIFDQCTAVVAERHADRVLTMVPQWWGVLVIRGDDTPTLGILQKADDNPSVDPLALVRLLWRDEVHSALVTFGSDPSPRTGRVAMWEELLRIAQVDALRVIVRQALLGRHSAPARIPSQRLEAAVTATTGP